MAIAEREGARPPNPELPKGEVIFSRQLTLRELLEIKPGEKGETRNLLNDIPFNFEVRDLGDSLLHIASFSEAQPVSFREFFQLLGTAKPGGTDRRESQGVNAILADWRIILPEVQEKEPKSKRLYDFHKEHVPGFLEFEKEHFPLFWDFIKSSSSRKEEVNFFNARFSNLIHEENILAGRRQMASLSGSPIERFMLSVYLLIPGGKDRMVKSVAFSGDIDRRYFVSLDGRVRTTISYGYKRRFVSRLVSAEGFTPLANGQIEIRRGDSFMRVSMKETGGEYGYRVPKIEELHLTTPEPETMVPIIVWERDKATEKRVYHDGKFGEFPGHDTLLGQLVVSAYSPQVRDQMPFEVKMKGVDGKKETQQMLEAQSVLLVPMFAQKFLEESPVIASLEALRR